MKRLFVDMDGTLCRFYEKALCVERSKEPGFFLELNPYENLLEAIRMLRYEVICAKGDFCVYFLTAVCDSGAAKDKAEWLRRYVGAGAEGYYVKDGQSKAQFVSTLFNKGSLTKDDYLLDDYSKNLVEWEAAGGTAIKFRNELNGRAWNGYNFAGHAVYFDLTPAVIVHDILKIMDLAGIPEPQTPDFPVTEEELRAEIDKIMDGELGWHKSEDGSQWETELYADYRDDISDSALKQIFNSECPTDEFYDVLDSWYADADYDTRDQISSTVRKALGKIGGAFATDSDGYFLDGVVEGMYQDLFDDGLFSCTLPSEHFLKQPVRLAIMMDMGDSNRDFVDNAVYPFWDGIQGEEIRDTASIVWLARTQGYSKDELQKQLSVYEDSLMLDKTGFFETLGQELINMTTHMAVLTFLVETTLEETLRIAELMDPMELKHSNPSIVLRKDTEVGLFDPWNGAGGPFEISLEKDVEIFLKDVYSAKPDGCKGDCSVARVYGMSGSAWRPTLLAIKDGSSQKGEE